MSERPSFQFYPGAWRNNAKLRRCSPAVRGIWMDVLCVLHDSDTYGIVRWPLKDLANAAGAPLRLVRELVDKGVLKGCEAGQTFEGLVYRPKSGRRVGPAVALVEAQAGPIWCSSRMVRDEHLRRIRGGTEPGTDGDHTEAPMPGSKPPPHASPKGGLGEGKGGGLDPYVRGRSSSSSSSSSEAAAESSPPLSRATSPPAIAADPSVELERRAEEIAALLVRQGVSASAAGTAVRTLAADPRATDALIVEAVRQLEQRDGAGAFGPGLVGMRVGDLAQHPHVALLARYPRWRSDHQQCGALGRAVGLPAQPGEDFAPYRERLAEHLAGARREFAQ